MDVYELDAFRCRELLAGGEISVRELTQVFLDRVEERDADVRAFLAVNGEEALAQAADVDSRPLSERTSWEGIPVGLKDVLCVKGRETTAGSRMLEGYHPPYDATAVSKLREAGLISLGRLNMDEFAMGSSTENSAFFPTHNPWDLMRVPGGSSGGSAASVSAGEVPWSLGTDTGGSIRQPASLCGVVGLKPTYGAVSRHGLIAFASSLDQVGPITRNVRDAAALLGMIQGKDPLDSTSVGFNEPIREPTTVDLSGRRFGIIKEFIGAACEPGVRRVFNLAVSAIEALGGECEEVSLPSTERGLSAYYIIAPAEASSNLARFDGVRYGMRTEGALDLMDMYKRTRSEGFGAEVKRRIMIGTHVLSAGYYDAYYGQAQRTRTLIIRDFEKAFTDYDVLISPTSPTIAFKLGERVEDPLAMYQADLCTNPVSLAGLPGLSLPAGFSEGMPVGVQLVAPHFADQELLEVGFALERELDVSTKPDGEEVAP